MIHNACSYLAILLNIIILDVIWLSFTFAKIYQKHLGHVFMNKPLWLPAVLFYLLYAFGLHFVVVRQTVGQSMGMIFLIGFIFGAVAYGTYDLTNQAIIKDWPPFITMIDIVWGGFISGVAAAMGAWIFRSI